MTKSHALTRIHETYTEDELLNGKDELDTAIATHLIGSAKIFTLYDNGGPTGHATRIRVKQAFYDAGHGKSSAKAIANARRIFRQDEAR
ncbi:MAG: hypothetical protein GWP69_22235 [Gammaproteobacteria bacterium]|nr:hypothetical protein [Gammaproteobacteria bacterium]NCF81525.1 hypothetical protein [Pseudomonadota bacterium]